MDGKVWVNAFREISTHHDILFLEDVAGEVAQAARQGEDVLWSDGAHWAELGHQIAGKTLVQHLRPLLRGRPGLLARGDVVASDGR